MYVDICKCLHRFHYDSQSRSNPKRLMKKEYGARVAYITHIYPHTHTQQIIKHALEHSSGYVQADISFIHAAKVKSFKHSPLALSSLVEAALRLFAQHQAEGSKLFRCCQLKAVAIHPLYISAATIKLPTSITLTKFFQAQIVLPTPLLHFPRQLLALRNSHNDVSNYGTYICLGVNVCIHYWLFVS